jgi:hypothetical protein
MINSLVWHPDGKQIFFSDSEYIFTVSAAGGSARLIFDSYYLHPYEGKRYILNQSINDIAGISPDGKYLYFTRTRIGTGSGAEITISIRNNGYSTSISKGKWALERLDVQTGEILTISMDDAIYPIMSISGKYITYTAAKLSKQRVVDTLSLKEWDIPVQYPFQYPWGFAQDKYLLYAQDQQLFRIPLQGGESVLATALNNGSAPYPSIFPSHLSLNGAWALCTVTTGERYSNSIVNPDSTKRYSFDKPVFKLVVYNLNTGIATDALPACKYIDPRWAHFSPDGKQFCYVLENDEGSNYGQEWSLYIKDFTPPQGEGEKPLTVADAAPVSFSLTGNYPNPFNPSTTISFSLPSSAPVSLCVYDITGRKVQDLMNGPLSAGAHSVVWDGRDASGKAVSSGVYLSRLTQGEKTVSRRMLLMK